MSSVVEAEEEKGFWTHFSPAGSGKQILIDFNYFFYFRIHNSVGQCDECDLQKGETLY